MKYELVFLLNEESETKNLRDLLTSLKIKLVKEEVGGKRALSYPIKKHTSAVYYFWQIEADKKVVAELRKKLNYNEKLIRYLLLVND